MPLRLDVKRKLLARSDRVKSVDLHPNEPWMLASLYNGNAHIWNYESQQLVKSFEVCELPVRAARFVVRKNWVVTGSDDMHFRVFNYNTLERVHQFEAHSDYLRSIAVHPTQPFVLTSSDDMLIKLWDWEKNWQLKQTFEGHTHYVMQLVINPKDNNTFATASLDRTIKVWQFGSNVPNFTLEGHEKGVNCVDYYHGGDKPYLISGADDRLIKIWDYQNKSCVATLDGHSHNVSAVCFHPSLPIIITGSEDSTVRIWHANTHRLETTLNYGLDRVWCIAALKGGNTLAIGYDEGSVTVKLGREEPAISMDFSGKVIWARHAEMQQTNLKTIEPGILDEAQDGERLPLSVKDMGSCEVFPQKLEHSPNGRYVVACGDGEWIVYTATALRNKSFGQGQDFAWALDSNSYAVQESGSVVKIFKNFKEVHTLKPDIAVDGLNGGPLLAVRGANSLCLYDWEHWQLVRRIEIAAKSVYWSIGEGGATNELLAIAAEDSFYVLRYNADAVARANVADIGPDGIEEAFDVVGEFAEQVKTGFWIGHCFLFTNALNRLSYYVGGELVTIAHTDRPLYLLGYISKDNRVYACDKDLQLVSYRLLLPVLEYQTAVMRQDFDAADRLLKSVPEAQHTRIAQFLEKQGFKKQALAVSRDPRHRFDLALALEELNVAHKIAVETDEDEMWRQLGQVATVRGNIELAEECLERSNDFGGRLLLASSLGSRPLMSKLSADSYAQSQFNVAFMTAFLLGDIDRCVNVLVESNRIPEAAFFARTYAPSHVPRLVSLWRDEAAQHVSGAVAKRNVGESLADPIKYENLFPGYTESLEAEKRYRSEWERLNGGISSEGGASSGAGLNGLMLNGAAAGFGAGAAAASVAALMKDSKKDDDYVSPYGADDAFSAPLSQSREEGGGRGSGGALPPDDPDDDREDEGEEEVEEGVPPLSLSTTGGGGGVGSDDLGSLEVVSAVSSASGGGGGGGGAVPQTPKHREAPGERIPSGSGGGGQQTPSAPPPDPGSFGDFGVDDEDEDDIWQNAGEDDDDDSGGGKFD